MYSVVLMAALTTSVDLPDRKGGCHGCHGCRGGGYSSGCCGCSGGGYGMGYGGGCMGGMGYGGGCMGGMGYGGCYGGMGYGGGCMSYGGGCMGGMGYGGGCMGYGGMGMGSGMMMPSTTQQGETIKKKPSSKDESMLPTPATILVQLPADAKLLIDNEATTSKGSSRVFQSPALNPGKEYHYTLTAEVVRDGKPVKFERVVSVMAGQTTPVTLTETSVGVAQR